MKNENDLFRRMCDEAGDITVKYSPIYGICVDVCEIEPKSIPARYRFTVTCEGKVMLSQDVSTYEEFSAAATRGLGIGLGVDDTEEEK